MSKTNALRSAAPATYKSYGERIGAVGWVPRWEQIANWRREHGGVSGGVNAKRRQGRGHAARKAAKP